MDTFRSMVVFRHVVEAGSFAGAAGQLNLTAAAVSKQIKALEQWLGTRLFDRTTRRVRLTEAGEAFYRRCVGILDEVAAARDDAGRRRTVPRGHMRVSAPVTFGTMHLAPVVTDYLREYPDVTVEVELSDRAVDLIAEGFDVAVRIGELPDSSLVARRLSSSRFALCAAPAYLARHGAPATPEALTGHACLEYSYRPPHGRWRFVGSGGDIVVPIRPRLRANNGEFLRAAALRGEGIALAPTFIVGDDLRSGRLVGLLPDYRPAATPIQAVYPAGRYLPAKVRSFIDFLHERFAGTPPWDAE